MYFEYGKIKITNRKEQIQKMWTFINKKEIDIKLFLLLFIQRII
jgi:hypothetical protein